MIGFTVEIWGDHACFSRPELKVERVSYDFITPSAARGILEAVFWKPAIRYVIDEIQICAPIRFENIKRNEVKSKVSVGKSGIVASEDRTQRASLVLRDVRYIVSAHFEKGYPGARDRTENGAFNHGKFADCIRRRLKKGQCYHMPYLGTREFPAKIRLVEEGDDVISPISETRSLGLMFYDFDYEKEFEKDADGSITGFTVKSFTPTYFNAEMKNGIIDLRQVEVLR
jgi:CRISPR-associated protein Cas5d